MNIYRPFTYLIGWTKYNKWYYGVRYCKDCDPFSLWSTYFTSSKKVKEFCLINGDPDIIEIRRIFVNVDQAILWEQKVLRRLNVLRDDKWLNIALFSHGKLNNIIKERSYPKGEAHHRYGKPNLELIKRNKSKMMWTKDVLEKFSIDKSNRIWVTKENKNRLIKTCELEKFARDGWTRGRLPMKEEQKRQISETLKKKI